MKITRLRHAIALLLPLLTGACNHVFDVSDDARVTGESPGDVASSLLRIRARLAPDKQVEFGQAVNTLTLAMPDKHDERSIGYMTPTFAAMVKGRDADQIIQLAALYRSAVPLDRGGH
jgi:hypothetical protein